MGRADVGMLASHRVPPIEWGKKPSPRCDNVRDEAGRPWYEIIVVVVVVVVVVEYNILFKDNYCWTARLRHLRFVSFSYSKTISFFKTYVFTA